MSKNFHAFGGVDITVQVMAVAEVSAEHEDGVEPTAQTLQHEDGIHPPGAHGQYRPHIGRILAPGDAGQVGRGVGTPFTQESQNLGFEPLGHIPLLVFSLV
jgi:hypothetical protein